MQGLLDIQNVEYVLEKLKTYNNLFVLVLQNIKESNHAKCIQITLCKARHPSKKFCFQNTQCFPKLCKSHLFFQHPPTCILQTERKISMYDGADIGMFFSN